MVRKAAARARRNRWTAWWRVIFEMAAQKRRRYGGVDVELLIPRRRKLRLASLNGGDTWSVGFGTAAHSSARDIRISQQGSASVRFVGRTNREVFRSQSHFLQELSRRQRRRSGSGAGAVNPPRGLLYAVDHCVSAALGPYDFEKNGFCWQIERESRERGAWRRARHRSASKLTLAGLSERFLFREKTDINTRFRQPKEAAKGSGCCSPKSETARQVRC